MRIVTWMLAATVSAALAHCPMAKAQERSHVVNVYAWAEYFPPWSSRNSRRKPGFT